MLADTQTTRRVHAATIDSPIGPLRIVADERAVRRIDMLDHAATEPERAHTAARCDPLHAAAEQLRAYFDHRLTDFDLPLAIDDAEHPPGTPFQRRVWGALRAVRYGERVSYAALAARIGAPNAARAVGLANARNPLPIVVPCHRVIGADGSLTGYAGGVQRKGRLLALEAAPEPAIAAVR